jgi:hypothetical protein
MALDRLLHAGFVLEVTNDFTDLPDWCPEFQRTVIRFWIKQGICYVIMLHPVATTVPDPNGDLLWRWWNTQGVSVTIVDDNVRLPVTTPTWQHPVLNQDTAAVRQLLTFCRKEANTAAQAPNGTLADACMEQHPDLLHAAMRGHLGVMDTSHWEAYIRSWTSYIPA